VADLHIVKIGSCFIAQDRTPFRRLAVTTDDYLSLFHVWLPTGEHASLRDQWKHAVEIFRYLRHDAFGY
jgi:hypothetical protein